MTPMPSRRWTVIDWLMTIFIAFGLVPWVVWMMLEAWAGRAG